MKKRIFIIVMPFLFLTGCAMDSNEIRDLVKPDAITFGATFDSDGKMQSESVQLRFDIPK